MLHSAGGKMYSSTSYGTDNHPSQILKKFKLTFVQNLNISGCLKTLHPLDSYSIFGLWIYEGPYQIWKTPIHLLWVWSLNMLPECYELVANLTQQLLMKPQGSLLTVNRSIYPWRLRWAYRTWEFFKLDLLCLEKEGNHNESFISAAAHLKQITSQTPSGSCPLLGTAFSRGPLLPSSLGTYSSLLFVIVFQSMIAPSPTSLWKFILPSHTSTGW